MNNLKLILRTYSALRQMSPDDLALLETLRALNDSDREVLVETLSDKPVGKKAGKKSSKSSSKRASALSDTIRSRAQERVMTKDDGGDDLCGQCGKPADDNFHHLKELANYHPFVEAVPPAPDPSLASTARGVGVASSGVGGVSAGAAMGGSSE